jgi:hypothetical protein
MEAVIVPDGPVENDRLQRNNLERIHQTGLPSDKLT